MIKQSNTPMIIENVLIFLISQIIRQRENTEIGEDELRDCIFVT